LRQKGGGGERDPRNEDRLRGKRRKEGGVEKKEGRGTLIWGSNRPSYSKREKTRQQSLEKGIEKGGGA